MGQTINTSSIESKLVTIDSNEYNLSPSRRLRPGSNGLLKLVVRNTAGEVIRHYPLLMAIAKILDNEHECQTVISADGWNRPVIVIPNNALTK